MNEYNLAKDKGYEGRLGYNKLKESKKYGSIKKD